MASTVQKTSKNETNQKSNTISTAMVRNNNSNSKEIKSAIPRER